MVEIDPRIYDPDGDAGTRFGAASVDDFKGGMGLVGVDRFQSPLLLELRVGEVRSGDVVSSGLEFSHRDAAVLGGCDAAAGKGGR